MLTGNPQDELEAIHYIGVITNIVAILNPDLSPEERTNILKKLGMFDGKKTNYRALDTSTQNGNITYKIKGTEEKDITEIEENETINFKNDGIYKLIAYSYGEEGNKSKTAQKIIKINKTELEASLTYTPETATIEPVIAKVTFNKEGVMHKKGFVQSERGCQIGSLFFARKYIRRDISRFVTWGASRATTERNPL